MITAGIITETDVQRMAIYELAVKNIPSVLFLIAAYIRYNEIKSIGLARIT